MRHAVVLSAHVIGLGVIRALGEVGIPVVTAVYDPRDMGANSRYVTRALTTPHPEHEEGAFVDRLLAIGRSEPGAVLFPADDATLSTVAKRRDELSRYFKVACCGWSTIEQVISKDRTYRLAADTGVAVPISGTPASDEQAEQLASAIGYPCLVKPCESHRYFDVFRRKMVRVDTRLELLAACRAAWAEGLRVMVQELIPGGDECGVNYNSYCVDGEVLAEFTSAKVRLSPPRFGVPRVVVSRWIPDVVAMGRAVLRALNYTGFSCTEFKRDCRDGRYVLMEVNARHNRSGLLAVRCGINFPLLEYRHLAFNERPSFTPYADGVYWIDDLKDIAHSIRYWPRERYSPAQLLKPYLRPHVFSVWDWQDRAPMWKRVRELARVGTAGASF